MELLTYIQGMSLESSAIVYAVCGAIGAFIRDLIDNDGCLSLPSRSDGNLNLGFLAVVAIGGFVGYVVDSSIIKALLAGFLSQSIIMGFLSVARKKGDA